MIKLTPKIIEKFDCFRKIGEINLKEASIFELDDSITEDEIVLDIYNLNYSSPTELDVFTIPAEKLILHGKKTKFSRTFNPNLVESLLNFHKQNIAEAENFIPYPLARKKYIYENKDRDNFEVVITSQINYIIDRIGYINIYKIADYLYDNNHKYRNSLFSQFTLDLFYPNMIDSLQYNIFTFDAIPDGHIFNHYKQEVQPKPDLLKIEENKSELFNSFFDLARKNNQLYVYN